MSIRIATIKGRTGNRFRLTERVGKDANGKWIEKGRGTFASLAEAEREKAKLLLGAEQQRAEATAGKPDPRVIDYFTALVDASELQRTVEPSTVEQARSFIRNHLTDLLGDKTMRGFTRTDAKDLMIELAKKGLAPASQRTIKNRLSSAFTVAFEEELIAGNPFTKLKVAGVRKSAGQVMTDEERAAFKTLCEKSHYGLLMRFLLATGLRRGEVSALVWRDINLTKGVVHVTKKLAHVGGRVYEGKPKSSRSVRTVGIPPAILDLLRAKYAADAELAATAGASVSVMPVFTSPSGKRLQPNYITERVKEALRSAGLGHLRTHDLRHAHATLLLQTVPIGAVSRRLGHSSSQITLGVYEHALPTDDDKATSAAGDFA